MFSQASVILSTERTPRQTPPWVDTPWVDTPRTDTPVLGRRGLCTEMSVPCTIGRQTRMKHYLTGTSLAGGKNRKKRFCVFLTDLDLFDLKLQLDLFTLLAFQLMNRRWCLSNAFRLVEVTTKKMFILHLMLTSNELQKRRSTSIHNLKRWASVRHK